MANPRQKRLRSHSRLTGRFETGGVLNVQVNSPASPLGESGGYHYYNATSNTEINWQVVNANGYLTRHNTNVIGNPTKNTRGADGGIEYIIGAGGGGGRHGGGGGGGIVGNGPLTPAPLRNNDLTAPQFTFVTPNNTIKNISINGSGSGYVGLTSNYTETVTIGGAGGGGTNGGNTAFFGRTAIGGGRGGSYNVAGTPGGCGGGGVSGGAGSQGGNGGGAFNPRPGGFSAGGGGGTAGDATNPVAGGGITLTLPTPVSIGGGGASGGSNPGPTCTGPQRPDGYCYGSFTPGTGQPGCSPGPGGGGSASSDATSNAAGGGGYPNGGGTSSGSAGAAWFKISTPILP